MKNIGIKEQIKPLVTNSELKTEKDKKVKLETYDLSPFIGQSYFNNDWVQLFLIFQPIYKKTITTFSALINTIVEWESEGMSNEKKMSL